jgi:hypothetical protein
VNLPLRDVILKRFEQPDEVREMKLGRFELVRIGNMTVGRATYQPGWRWSEHVGRALGEQRCRVEHVGLVLAGARLVGDRRPAVCLVAPARRRSLRALNLRFAFHVEDAHPFECDAVTCEPTQHLASAPRGLECS